MTVFRRNTNRWTRKLQPDKAPSTYLDENPYRVALFRVISLIQARWELRQQSHFISTKIEMLPFNTGGGGRIHKNVEDSCSLINSSWRSKNMVCKKFSRKSYFLILNKTTPPPPTHTHTNTQTPSGASLSKKYIPANTTRWSNDVLMLAQRLRRWPNIKTSLFQRVVLAGMNVSTDRWRPVPRPRATSTTLIMSARNMDIQHLLTITAFYTDRLTHRILISTRCWPIDGLMLGRRRE